MLKTKNIILEEIENRIFRIFINDFKTAKLSDALDLTESISDYYRKNRLTKVGILMIEFGHGASVDKEAREFAASKEANKYTKGAAILVKNLSQQLIGDYYLRFNHPRYPTKVFYNKEKALKWIRNNLEGYDKNFKYNFEF